MANTVLPEEELIDFLKPRLKALGFKKKGKRWTKVSGDFTLWLQELFLKLLKLVLELQKK